MHLPVATRILRTFEAELDSAPICLLPLTPSLPCPSILLTLPSLSSHLPLPSSLLPLPLLSHPPLPSPLLSTPPSPLSSLTLPSPPISSLSPSPLLPSLSSLLSHPSLHSPLLPLTLPSPLLPLPTLLCTQSSSPRVPLLVPCGPESVWQRPHTKPPHLLPVQPHRCVARASSGRPSLQVATVC